MSKQTPFWARFPDWSFEFSSEVVEHCLAHPAGFSFTFSETFHFITGRNGTHRVCVVSDGSLCPNQAMEELLDSFLPRAMTDQA